MFTVDEAINQMGFGPFQVLTSVFCGLLWVADAMELMLLSILSPIINCQWDLWIMLGSVLWGFMNDLIGRNVSCKYYCDSYCGKFCLVLFDANDYVTISLYAGSCLLFAVSMLLPIETTLSS